MSKNQCTWNIREKKGARNGEKGHSIPQALGTRDNQVTGQHQYRKGANNQQNAVLPYDKSIL